MMIATHSWNDDRHFSGSFKAQNIGFLVEEMRRRRVVSFVSQNIRKLLQLILDDVLPQG